MSQNDDLKYVTRLLSIFNEENITTINPREYNYNIIKRRYNLTDKDMDFLAKLVKPELYNKYFKSVEEINENELREIYLKVLEDKNNYNKMGNPCDNGTENSFSWINNVLMSPSHNFRPMIDVNTNQLIPKYYKTQTEKKNKDFISDINYPEPNGEIKNIPQILPAIINNNINSIQKVLLPLMDNTIPSFNTKLLTDVGNYENGGGGKIQNTGDMPLYFVVGRYVNNSIVHISIIVLNGGDKYSIGFGYIREKQGTSLSFPLKIIGINEGSIYTPDSIFDITKDSYKIIDIGIFTTTHIKKIQDILNNTLSVNILIGNITTNNIGTRKGKFSCLILQLKTNYSLCSTSNSNDNLNCTSFVERVFTKQRIDCTPRLIKYITNIVEPDYCRRIGGDYTCNQIDSIIYYYINNNVNDLLKLLNYCDKTGKNCNILGGKYIKKTKTKKMKKRKKKKRNYYKITRRIKI
jgi:hypothetical protein